VADALFLAEATPVPVGFVPASLVPAGAPLVAATASVTSAVAA
jgi:hypothetical protein